jgi:hypothetical protein
VAVFAGGPDAALQLRGRPPVGSKQARTTLGVAPEQILRLPEVPVAPLWMWAQRSGAATPVTFLKLQQT